MAPEGRFDGSTVRLPPAARVREVPSAGRRLSQVCDGKSLTGRDRLRERRRGKPHGISRSDPR